jgi:hypothetical protein
MPPAGFKPAVRLSERRQTLTIDRPAIGIGHFMCDSFYSCSYICVALSKFLHIGSCVLFVPSSDVRKYSDVCVLKFSKIFRSKVRQCSYSASCVATLCDCRGD